MACTETTYQQTADEMVVHPETDYRYREALFEKLKVKSRVCLVMYAVNNRLIQLEYRQTMTSPIIITRRIYFIQRAPISPPGRKSIYRDFPAN